MHTRRSWSFAIGLAIAFWNCSSAQPSFSRSWYWPESSSAVSASASGFASESRLSTTTRRI